MRILRVTTSGVGGVPDGSIELPESPVTAFAGANGTGKSKLLACLLSPWSQALPSPQSETSEVSVELLLSPEERHALSELSVETGWGSPAIPESFSLTTKLSPNVGIRRTTEPQENVLQHFFVKQPFLQRHTSFNAIYLPAERRLLATGQQGIDLNQLSEALAWQKTTEPRSAVQNYGRLDDQEFEQYAKALCVAASLPDEDGTRAGAERARVEWEGFKAIVDGLIAPKHLIPLTRQRPDQLRVGTPEGATHLVPDLSSGERQALVIMSRVLRAGAGHTVVIIDEPDAFLHPHLSQRLMEALVDGIGPTGQLIVATHSPAVLDSLPPTGIIRLQHGEPPRLVADESERVDLYRSAGFRASALTQSDLLLIVEGDSDASLLSLQFPSLSRAAVRSAGSRARVFREVEQLSPFELPVLGVVDADVLSDPPPAEIAESVEVWPTADIEGLYLSSDEALERMLLLGLLKPEFARVEDVQRLLLEILESLRENVIAELAQRILRRDVETHWPSPRGENAIGRLLAAIGEMRGVEETDGESAVAEAERVWNEHSDNLWTLVRGKYVLPAFADAASQMRSGQALLEAVARSRPHLAGMSTLARRIEQSLK